MRPPLRSTFLPSTRLKLFSHARSPPTCAPRPLCSPLRRSLSTTSPLHYQPRRTTTSSASNPPDLLNYTRKLAAQRAYFVRRAWYSAFGLFACVAASYAALALWDLPPSPPKKTKTEAPAPLPPDAVTNSSGTTIEFVDKAATGASAVPWFPRVIRLPREGREDAKTAALPAGVGDSGEEYHLLGLGVRTVSFLRIQVYVVGLYVAASDLAALQAAFVRRAADVEAASALVPSEKERLREMLLDARESEVCWDGILREAGIRSVIRVVPTKSTEWSHLRDGWVRAVEGRGKRRREDVEAKFDGVKGNTEALLTGLDVDEQFGENVGKFKAIFSAGKRKGLAKGKAILLERDARGKLTTWVQGKSDQEKEFGEGFELMGELDDERISRLIWLGYLAGPKPSSPAARDSVVDGVIEAVGRPIGTVETKVV